MAKLQRYLVITVIWFFLLYNIERLIAPINIASFVYLFVAIVTVLVLSISTLQKIPFMRLFGILLIPYFILKVSLHYPVLGLHLPITITETVFISITLALALEISRDMAKLQEEIFTLTLSEPQNNARNFEVEQTQIYREIRRARHYNRPATMLAISPQEKSIEFSLLKFVEEEKKNITRRYVTARIAKILTEGLHDTDVITQRNNHFVILLPETNIDDAMTVIRRIESLVQNELGLVLDIGYSSFPEDGVTFIGLLETAEEKMKGTAVLSKQYIADVDAVESTKANILSAD